MVKSVHYLSLRAHAARKRLDRDVVVADLRRACSDIHGHERPDDELVSIPVSYLRLLADVIEGKAKAERGRKPDSIGSPEWFKRHYWASVVSNTAHAVDRARRMGRHINGNRVDVALQRVSERSGIPEGTLRDWYQHFNRQRSPSG